MFWSRKKEEQKVDTILRQKLMWFEIPATDFFRATLFYHKVFNIKINEIELNGIRHGIFELKNGQVSGAIVETHDKIGNGPVLFFDGTPSIYDLEKKIEANGGKIIVPKTLIKNQTSDGQSILPKNYINKKDNGYFAYFMDTEGNKMGLFGTS